jgi:general secretion pathway protein C
MAAETPKAAEAPAPATTTPSLPARPKGTIYRAELNEVLDKSPGLFFQQVESQPYFVGGRFEGWRLISFFPGDARFGDIELKPGDVVTKINGMPIEQPDQFIRVWESMRSATELAVAVERGGERRTLAWKILEK